MKSIDKKVGMCIVLILIGTIGGSLVGDILGSNFPSLKVLKTAYSIGMSKPAFLDLKVIGITFGLNINFNLMSIAGAFLAILLYRKY